jgi:hypothetical protein
LYRDFKEQEEKCKRLFTRQTVPAEGDVLFDRSGRHASVVRAVSHRRRHNADAALQNLQNQVN